MYPTAVEETLVKQVTDPEEEAVPDLAEAALYKHSPSSSAVFTANYKSTNTPDSA